MRKYVGQYLDVFRARLSDGQLLFLRDFIDGYDRYLGIVLSHTTEEKLYSSEGWYRRYTAVTYTFVDQIGIQVERAWRTDDGDSGKDVYVLNSAKAILEWFAKNGHRPELR